VVRRCRGWNERAGVGLFLPVPVALELRTQNGLVATTIPYGADQTVYLVIDRFRSGTVYRETEIERADRDPSATL
jgi:hypothetical protein